MAYVQKNAVSEQDVPELLELWSFPFAPTIEPTNRGTSNTTYFVKGQAGNFILKLYGDSTTTEQIQYEHSLLAYLQQANLSFAVPVPVPAKSGETLVHVSKNDTLLFEDWLEDNATKLLSYTTRGRTPTIEKGYG